jgi:ATP-dependent Clp endopeptidase proteolytic subunit ClpP
MELQVKFSDKKKKEPSEEDKNLITFINSAIEKPSLRITGIYGDITEEKCSEAIYGLLALHESGREVMRADPDDEESKLVETYMPMEFYISTYGGSANEMFAVYDIVRYIRDYSPILTHGIGKVMSAGVLLLSSGTKGERRIGKHCRIMIHGVVSGQHGHLSDVENEFEEAKSTQKLYIDALAAETNMTPKYIKKLMDKKTNVYFNASEAVDLGIADIVV